MAGKYPQRLLFSLFQLIGKLRYLDDFGKQSTIGIGECCKFGLQVFLRFQDVPNNQLMLLYFTHKSHTGTVSRNWRL